MPRPFYMELILTADCNLRCAYCWIKGKRPEYMSMETARAAVDFLIDASGNTTKLTILFFGGEPLLCFDLIRQIEEYAQRRAQQRGKMIEWNMTTNGTLLTPEIARWCAQHKLKYLLSMDGARERHDRFRRFPDGSGSFDVIARKIPMLKRFQPWLGARMSITPEGCSYLWRDIEDLHHLGVNQFLLGYAHGIPWTVADLRTYEMALREVCELYLRMHYARRPFRMTMFEAGDLGAVKKKPVGFGCGAGRARFSVDPNGDIHGCSKMANINGVGQGVLPLGDVFEGMTRTENRLALLDNTIKPRTRCQVCEFKEQCAGCCPAINHFHNGSIYEPDDLSCQNYFLMQRVNEYMRERYREVFGRDLEDDGRQRGDRAARQPGDPGAPGQQGNKAPDPSPKRKRGQPGPLLETRNMKLETAKEGAPDAKAECK